MSKLGTGFYENILSLRIRGTSSGEAAEMIVETITFLYSLIYRAIKERLALLDSRHLLY